MKAGKAEKEELVEIKKQAHQLFAIAEKRDDNWTMGYAQGQILLLSRILNKIEENE